MLWPTYWAILILTIFSMSIIGLNGILDNDIIHGTIMRHFDDQNKVNLSFIRKFSEIDQRLTESELEKYKRLDALQNMVRDNSRFKKKDSRIAGVTDLTEYQ